MRHDSLSERVLLLAPRGRDSAIAAAILSEASIAAEPCGSVPELIEELDRGSGAVIVTEEALVSADLNPLDVWLRDQAEWSDLSFVLLTHHGGGLERNPRAKRFLDVLRNVTFLERPFHPTTLVSVVQSALRGRRRQYEARAQLHVLRESEESLREETQTLETLNRTGAVIAGELDLERVVQAVTDAGVALVGASFGIFSYGVLNEDGVSSMLYTLSGAERSDFDGFDMSEVIAELRPTIVGEGVIRSDDILSDPGYGRNAPRRGMPNGHLPVRSYLAVPVALRSGEVIGGLFFGHPAPARFTERHEQLIVGIAGQAATAIDNARLYQAVQRSNQTLEQRVSDEVAERAKAEEALQQAQKMEAIGQLTGGVAHDFNNLLTVIKSSTDLLRRPDLAEERRRRYVDAISDTVDRASRLTGQLLAFARRQALKPEVFNVGERIQAITEMLGTLIGSRIQIVTRVPDEPCYVMADVSQFEIALVNLAVNARDAMNGEGTLSVRVHPATHGPDGTNREFVSVALTDTGSGIPEDKLRQIFEPFFTTKEVGKGTGLGLSQVFGFVKQSGGDVFVESNAGDGATFTLYLPRVQAGELEHTSPDTAWSGEVEDHGGGRKVLVVEDNVDVGRFSTQILQDLGYETTWVSNGDEALKCLTEVGGFDVVFSDVVMPGMTGVELGHRIRRLRPGLPVVLTSGYSHVLAEQGRHGFELLQKPYAVEDLSRMLRRATRGNRTQVSHNPRV